MARHLPGDDDERNRIHIGGGDAGHGVGNAGAGSHQANAGLAGRARVSVGGVRRALLVAHEDMANLFLLKEFVVNDKHRAAGIAENQIDFLLAQAAH